MLWAKQSTAATLIIGPILDSSGVEYTGAVIGDISLSKNGGTLTALAAAATLTHIANGQYTLVLTTGNTDTLGRAQFTCNKSTYQMPPLELMVIPATVFDALVTNATNTTGGLPAATGAISALAGAISTYAGGAVASVTAGVTVTTNNDKTGYSLSQAFPSNFASLAITAGGIVSADVQTIKTQTVTCTASVTVLASVGTAATSTAQTGDSYARIGANGAGLTGIVLPSGGLANVTAWSVAITGNITGNLSGSVGSVTSAVVLPSIPANWLTAAGIAAGALNGKGDWLLSSAYTTPPTAAANAAATWDITTTGHTTAGTFGALLGATTDPLLNDVPGSYAQGTAGYVLGSLLNHPVTYTGPINPVTGAMTLTRGDDYLAADNRALTYAFPYGSGNVSLSGATVVAYWLLQSVDTVSATTTATASVSGAGTGSQALSIDLTAAKTTLLSGSRYLVKVIATLADASVVTLFRVNCTVIDP